MGWLISLTLLIVWVVDQCAHPEILITSGLFGIAGALFTVASQISNRNKHDRNDKQ